MFAKTRGITPSIASLKRLKTASLLILTLCICQLPLAVQAADSPQELLKAAEQRLHWEGLYLNTISISISEDRMATVTGTVESGIVKDEVEETLSLTDGIRGVINRLVVSP